MRLLAAVFFVCVTAIPALAADRSGHSAAFYQVTQYCGDRVCVAQTTVPHAGRVSRGRTPTVTLQVDNAAYSAPGVGAGRPAGCPRLWCGCWSRLDAGIADTAFNLAWHWLTLRHVVASIGSYAVMARKGGGHVGRVIAIDEHGNPTLISGNHGHRVGIGTYPARRIKAYVQP